MSGLAFGALLLVALACGGLVMGVAYGIAKRRKDMGWVDVGWTLGLVAAAPVLALLAGGHPARRVLVAGMVALWGGRLGWMILRRLRQRPEDARYAELRRHWGPRTGRYMPLLFAAEALLVAVFAVPLIVVMRIGAPLGWGDALGGLIWLAAVGGEWLADAQLARFRSAPWNRGKTCRDGLWRYSRHPNYFCEWLHWWAYVVMAAVAGGGLVMLPTLLGPALMALFLLKLTGIPHAERQALAHRGEEYRAYQRTTSAFFPWFPRKQTEVKG